MKTTEPNTVLKASVSFFFLFELRLSFRVAKSPPERVTSLVFYKRFSPQHAVTKNEAWVLSSPRFLFLNFYLIPCEQETFFVV